MPDGDSLGAPSTTGDTDCEGARGQGAGMAKAQHLAEEPSLLPPVSPPVVVHHARGRRVRVASC